MFGLFCGLLLLCNLTFSQIHKIYIIQRNHQKIFIFRNILKLMSIALRLGVSNIHRRFSSMAGIVENTIRDKLLILLEAKYLDVINESYMHNVPKGAETHFKVVVVSEKFDGLPLIKRHRLVNDILKDELQTGVHALSIVAKTPKQWEESDKVVESSPTCRGGFGK